MMHLCTVATLCFFKITSPRNYYYCDQDDFPWVCVSKYVSKSNCCHRHLVLYISDVKKFPYLPKIYISAIIQMSASKLCLQVRHDGWGHVTSRSMKKVCFKPDAKQYQRLFTQEAQVTQEERAAQEEAQLWRKRKLTRTT